MDADKETLVRRLIGSRESKNVDFKVGLDLSSNRARQDLAVDAVSFANAEGGYLVVGVEDASRKVVELTALLDHDKTVQTIIDLTDPPVDVSVDMVLIDGKQIGLISLQKGRQVHRLRNGRSVYIRRDGMNYKATDEEIVMLSDERNYSSRVRLEEPVEFHSVENGVFMLSGKASPYRKIAKGGALSNLSECPVFLPEFSTWVSAPEFGNTKGSLLVSYPNIAYVTHKEFGRRVQEVEKRLAILGRYLDAPPVIYWSISSDGALCYGCGGETLLRALDDGELGVISIASCGESRGSDRQRSFLLLVSGYCKSKQDGFTLVQDSEVRLYLSAVPISPDWVRSLVSPFLDEDRIPFNTLSYELVHPRLRVWRSRVPPQSSVQIEGVVRKYRYRPEHSPLIGAAVASTDWFSSRLYAVDTEWKGGNPTGDLDWGSRIFEAIEKSQEMQGCPIEYLEECIVSLTNPIAFFDDIEGGKTKSFHLPLIKHLELDAMGHTVHVLGLNASPIEGRG